MLYPLELIPESQGTQRQINNYASFGKNLF